MISIVPNPTAVFCDIRSETSLESLKMILKRLCQTWGFHGYTHLDTGHPEEKLPFHVTTARMDWVNHYVDAEFLPHDPILFEARRRNGAFTWTDIEIPKPRFGPKPKRLLVMDSARDFGFSDGLVVPHHSVDGLGRPRSALTVFFWNDRAPLLRPLMRDAAAEMKLLIPSWQERVAELVWNNAAPDIDLEARGVSDREREVLAWAARGKTIEDTATILGLAPVTVENQIRSAIRKLGCLNKTHAVARAIYYGVIDP